MAAPPVGTRAPGHGEAQRREHRDTGGPAAGTPGHGEVQRREHRDTGRPSGGNTGTWGGPAAGTPGHGRPSGGNIGTRGGPAEGTPGHGEAQRREHRDTGGPAAGTPGHGEAQRREHRNTGRLSGGNTGTRRGTAAGTPGHRGAALGGQRTETYPAPGPGDNETSRPLLQRYRQPWRLIPVPTRPDRDLPSGVGDGGISEGCPDLSTALFQPGYDPNTTQFHVTVNCNQE